MMPNMRTPWPSCAGSPVRFEGALFKHEGHDGLEDSVFVPALNRRLGHDVGLTFESVTGRLEASSTARAQARVAEETTPVEPRVKIVLAPGSHTPAVGEGSGTLVRPPSSLKRQAAWARIGTCIDNFIDS